MILSLAFLPSEKVLEGLSNLMTNVPEELITVCGMVPLLLC